MRFGSACDRRFSSSSSSRCRSASRTSPQGARAAPITSTPPVEALPGLQNGLALAGDYMSAASFLGIAGLVALSGFDGLIYSIGFLVGWPVVMFLIAEPLRNLGQVHVCRRRGVPAAAGARARGRGGRFARGHVVLPDRADGGRGQPHQAALRLRIRTRGRHRRRRDAGLRALRRHDGDDVGADYQGRAAA